VIPNATVPTATMEVDNDPTTSNVAISAGPKEIHGYVFVFYEVTILVPGSSFLVTSRIHRIMSENYSIDDYFATA
jgi:hypothetical protein